MNVLGIGAHFDDLELGCSGTLISHVDKGDRVIMLVITNSAYNNHSGDLVRGKDIAYNEGAKAAGIIGAELICMNYETFLVPFEEALTKEICRYIEEYDIDVIYCPWIHDLHRDHHYAAKNTLMAGRHVPRFLMYRSNYYDTEQTFKGNFYSDITSVMDRKMEVIKAHKSELERVRLKWLDFFKNQNANDGQKIGVEYAECFEVVRFLF
jgi:LmbE family N-acetylglucosaminyl deacetylase|tara:strand:- start:1889 stop:2515 length:627 start_codon:yes stop_codon:yes gene_type:complete